MFRKTSKLQILLLLAVLNSLSGVYSASFLPRDNQHNRMKRFGIFRPSPTNRCILACDACSRREPEYIDIVSHFFEWSISNLKNSINQFYILFQKQKDKDIETPAEIICANECLEQKVYYNVVVELLLQGMDKKYVKCFLRNIKKYSYFRENY